MGPTPGTPAFQSECGEPAATVWGAPGRGAQPQSSLPPGISLSAFAVLTLLQEIVTSSFSGPEGDVGMLSPAVKRAFHTGSFQGNSETKFPEQQFRFFCFHPFSYTNCEESTDVSVR